MREPTSRAPHHLRGLARLTLDATLGVTDLVEAMHLGISRPWIRVGHEPVTRTRGVTGIVYRTIRTTSRVAIGGVDAALALFEPLLPAESSSSRVESSLAALNGVLGDHLVACDNPLAIPPRLRQGGRDLSPSRDGIAPIHAPKRRVVVLVHGLCRSDRHWHRNGHDHGEALSGDLDVTPIYFRFNSGLHVSTNGRALSSLLEELLAAWPVPLEELAIVGHSLGGLVARSACHYAQRGGHRWPRRLRHLIFLGTPHHGVPLERGGQWLHRMIRAAPYARPLARLGSIRSAGITDLRHGNLLDEDWEGRDRFGDPRDRRSPVPLPNDVFCGAIGASRGTEPAGPAGRWAWDGWVPLDSALGRHADPERDLRIPEDRRWIARGMDHFDLLDRSEVYERLRSWLSG
jgi:hypothetical protein